MLYTITNVSSSQVDLNFLNDKTLQPSEAITFSRDPSEMDVEDSFKALMVAGTITTTMVKEAGDGVPVGYDTNFVIPRVGLVSPIAVVANDSVVISKLTAPGAVSVTLPASPTFGLLIRVIDGTGDAGANNITITPAAGTINGGASLVINTNYGEAWLVRTATEWLGFATTVISSGAAGGKLSGTYPNPGIAAGAISADATGRAYFAADFFDAATFLAKFATDSIDNAQLLKAVKDGAFAASAPTLALFADGLWTQAKLVAASLDGTIAKVIADANVIGALPVVHRKTLSSGANADVDILLTHKTRITDVKVVLKGAGTAGSIVTVKNVVTAITNAIDVSAGGDKAVFRDSTIDDAQQEIAAGANLRISYASTGADFPGAEVYVHGLRVT